MMEGRIIKALSGFYYVDVGEGRIITCRGRGKFRHQKITPLVGDLVGLTLTDEKTGMVDSISPRRNAFSRPAVANIDQLVIIASGATPVTDPFLIDRMTTIAQTKECASVIVLNKCDLNRGDDLAEIYRKAGFITLQLSAETGEGIPELRELLSGKVSAFTGNSGVGKSSVLNALFPGVSLPVGEVSEKLGRGRHTTRHVELFYSNSAYVADTPGFSSFDVERMELIRKEDLAAGFQDFLPYLDQCRFVGCSHTKEKGCAVLDAVRAGDISRSRHESYLRLYEQAREIRDWER